MNSIKLFISYARIDRELEGKLVKQLAPLKRTGAIEIWDDRAIDAGGP